MSVLRLICRSIARFWLADLGVALGLAVAATVIAGALIVGDSMRYSLGQIAQQRLGEVQYGVIGGDRFFTRDFAESLADEASAVVMVEGVVSPEGVASTPSGDRRRRASAVSIVGGDKAFAGLSGLGSMPEPGTAVLSRALAEQLQAEAGDRLIIRVPKPSALPIDAALVNASDPAVAMRVVVDRVAADDAGGRFSLRAEQRAPMTVFVDGPWLAEQLEIVARANVALSSTRPGALDPSLSDLELTLRETEDGPVELASPRVFLDASIESDLQSLPGARVLTYMVNTVAIGENASPYAMVTAADGLGGLSLANNQIALNRWLAEDLDADVGDRVSLTYYLPDEGDRLTEAKAQLTVAAIVPIEGVFADRTLTPDFPGLAEAQTLSRWDAGPAIDRSRIRDKDEAYWDQYRATPKAFINLDTGQQLWSNRFGTLTSIRFEPGVSKESMAERIDASSLGLVVTDLASQADRAATGTVDFGQLFLSLSAFIIIAAVLLSATLFAMSTEQRARQLGLMRAVGLTRRRVLGLMLGEAAVVAIVGAGLGMLGGIGYGYVVIGALTSEWAGAVANAPVQLLIKPGSVVIGVFSAAVVGLVAIVWSVRALTAQPARSLLSGAVGKVSRSPRLPASAWYIVGGVLVIVGVWLDLLTRGSHAGMVRALIGFAGGALVLAGATALLAGVLARLSVTGRQRPTKRPTWPVFALRNMTRRRGRSIAAVMTLACGLFMVVAVSGFRLSVASDPSQRQSGTGGFALIVETTQPIPYDLNSQLGRDHYAISEDELPPGSVVPFRMSSGDDASCLNLNQTPTPRLLGVDPSMLARRDAFGFMASTAEQGDWMQLNNASSDRIIPAIADSNTAQWALKVTVGDTLELIDERGRPFTIRLVATIENSILQGSLIIDERRFAELFPSLSGDRLLLIDASDQAARVEREALLNDVLTDEGAIITPTTDRLAEFNRVQNTYLTIFQSLGGLGVVLGAVGMGVIAARSLIERRSELALLFALGLTRGRIRAIVLLEQMVMLTAGLVIGLVGAAVATAHSGHILGGAFEAVAVTGLGSLLVGTAAVFIGIASIGFDHLPRVLRND